MSYRRNPEGYSDPTAGEALEHIVRDERRRRRALLKAEKEQLEDKPHRLRYLNQPKSRRQH